MQCAVNRSGSLGFERVHTLVLTCGDTSWPMETFQFIQQTFPNLRTLSLQCEFFVSGLDYYDGPPEERFPKIFADEFSSNVTIQLPSITKLCLDLNEEQYHQQTLRCLFQLLPNLVNIETNDFSFFCDYMRSGGHYVDSLVNSLPLSKLSSYKTRTDLFLTYRYNSACKY